jgi:hypothetical protein
MCFGNRTRGLGLGANVHIYNSLGGDQLNMIRDNSDTTFTAALYLMSSKIDNEACLIPYLEVIQI